MTRLPATPIRHAAAWRGAELFHGPGSRLELDSGVRAELLDADGGTEQLRSFGTTVAERLESGPGVVLVRGFPIDATEDTCLGRFERLVERIGTPIPQSASGELVLRVEDERLAPGDPRVRGPHTSRGLGFHTDRCDVIAFLCVRAALRGGETEIISSVSLFNELLERHPEHLEALGGTFPYLRHTVDPNNARRVTQVPLFTLHDGHFAASYLRVLIDRADREPGVPELTPAQRAALDALEEVAALPELSARFRLAPGDVLFLNNWVTLHRRSAFEDALEPARRRLLLRAWLSVPNSRPLDPRFADHFGATAAGALRGGLHSARQNWLGSV